MDIGQQSEKGPPEGLEMSGKWLCRNSFKRHLGPSSFKEHKYSKIMPDRPTITSSNGTHQ
jgi:hypothetical protein